MLEALDRSGFPRNTAVFVVGRPVPKGLTIVGIPVRYAAELERAAIWLERGDTGERYAVIDPVGDRTVRGVAEQEVIANGPPAEAPTEPLYQGERVTIHAKLDGPAAASIMRSEPVPEVVETVGAESAPAPAAAKPPTPAPSRASRRKPKPVH